MRTSSIVFICVFAACLPAPVDAGASFFEIELKRCAIYTPGNMNLTTRLTGSARVKGDYHFRVSVFAAGVLVGEKVLEAKDDKPSVFELEFPAQRSRTDARCRVELFMNKQFIESREISLALWPPASPYPDHYTDKTIWVYDTSGSLQKIFEQLKIDTIDAGFQAARVFSKPSVIFFGEETDTAGISRICRSLENVNPKPVVVFLRQKQFPEELGVETESSSDLHRVDCVMSSPFLKGLAEHDLMPLLRDITGVRIVPKENEFILADPALAQSKRDQGLLSYLAEIERGDQAYVYCQLPIVEDFAENPISGALLRNLIEFASDDAADNVPVIYHPLLKPDELQAGQLERILDKVRQSGSQHRKIWFVRVLPNEADRLDTFNAVVYYRPEYSSERLRKGRFFRIDGLTMTDDDRGEALDGNPPDEAAVCQDYCQVSSPDRGFGFELEVPPHDLLFPFSRGEDVSDEEVVEVADFVRSMAQSGNSYSGFKGDAPVVLIEKKDGLIEIRAGATDGLVSGAGHILRIRKTGARYELMNVVPWAL